MVVLLCSPVPSLLPLSIEWFLDHPELEWLSILPWVAGLVNDGGETKRGGEGRGGEDKRGRWLWKRREGAVFAHHILALLLAFWGFMRWLASQVTTIVCG